MMSKKFQIGLMIFSLLAIVAMSFAIVADAQKTMQRQKREKSKQLHKLVTQTKESQAAITPQMGL